MQTDPQSLVEAFALFSEVSERLTSTYQDLQGQVLRLSDELAEANLRLREQLEEKERMHARQSLLLNLLPGAVLVVDHAESIQDSNPQARRIFGDALARGSSWLQLSAQRLRSQGQGEWLLLADADGPEKRLSISFNPLPEGGGQILLVQDITASGALREAMQREKRLSAMGEMLANLAHQLRTPLAAALLYASQMQRQPADADTTQRFADKLLARLRHLESLINDMLLFVRGGPDLCQRAGVADLLNALQQLMAPLLLDKQLTLHVDTPIQDQEVLGGQDVLLGVLANLLQNAVYFSPLGGRIDLSVRSQGAALEFVVQDQGVGIDAAVQERLFDPFFTTRPQGTGLGLAIVREVVTQLGGSVWVRSTLGQGAVFGVRLPLADAQQSLSSGSQ